jgi:hypothetical protein
MRRAFKAPGLPSPEGGSRPGGDDPSHKKNVIEISSESTVISGTIICLVFIYAKLILSFSATVNDGDRIMTKAIFGMELETDGNVDLRGTGIVTLPDNLTVGGNLYLTGTRITTLPNNLTVGGKVLGLVAPAPTEPGAPRRGGAPPPLQAG